MTPTPEQIAAAERVRRVNSHENALAVYYPGPKPLGWNSDEAADTLAQLNFDRKILADAYLQHLDASRERDDGAMAGACRALIGTRRTRFGGAGMKRPRLLDLTT